MGTTRTQSGVRMATATCVVLLGCAGYATYATGLTSTSATFSAQASCSASSSGNPCTAWFQYWKDGSSAIVSTPQTQLNVNTNGAFAPLASNITGLEANTVYHYQLCGFGDTNINPPGACTGPLERGTFSGANVAGSKPGAGNFSATSNFRTASATTVGTVDLGRVLTSADTSEHPISRDSGFSVQYSSNPPRSLWLFDDTQQNGGFISFGSAASGPFVPGEAPQALSELPTPPAPRPGTAPTSTAPFLPVPAPLQQEDGAPCGTSDSYTATWNMGAAKEPGSSRVLIVYGETCVGSKYLLERVALGQYDPVANRFLRVDHPFVASPLNAGVAKRKRIGSPIFPGDGFVYFYIGFCPDSFCGAGSAVYIARVGATPAAWSNGANYRWWIGGTTWDANAELARSLVPGITPLGESVHVADYSGVSAKKYVMIAQSNLGVMSFKTYHSTSLTGPWSEGPSARVPQEGCMGPPLDSCYAIKGHPELSTSTQLLYSWYSPDDRDGFGHIRIGAIDW